MAKRNGGRGTFAGMIRGDLPIARRLGEPRMRRIIPQLQESGWPIFDFAGKRCAFGDDLDAMVREVLAGIGELGRKPEPTLKSPKVRKARAATAESTTNV
jgi:hypothetical protein